jgi:hypothetical protein
MRTLLHHPTSFEGKFIQNQNSDYQGLKLGIPRFTGIMMVMIAISGLACHFGSSIPILGTAHLGRNINQP